ncbi:MAG: hypothetical protein R6X35_13250 [Candidatus Krumholzibacteriia bacterium]
MLTKRILMLLATILLVLPAGCIFSPDDDPKGGGGDVPDLPFPNSPEVLMANFQKVYEDRNIDGYREVIDPEFRIYLSQATIDEFGIPDGYFDYDEEVLIAERMFSGSPFIRQSGAITPGITRIQFDYFQPETTWEVSPADDRIPNALRAQYRVNFTIEQGNEGRLKIEGIIEFYLRSEQVEHQGRTQNRFWMVGQVDYTNDN